MDEDESSRPFRRERNLSNRNFRRRGSNRRFSAESHNSVESLNMSNETETEPHTPTRLNTSSKTFLNASNSELENAFKQKSLLKIQQGEELQFQPNSSLEIPISPDPALMGFQQKLQRFETLKADEPIIFKIGKFNSKIINSGPQTLAPLRVLPTLCSTPCETIPTTPMSPQNLPTSAPPTVMARPQISTLYKSFNEAHSEDVVDHFDSDSDSSPGAEYALPSEADQELDCRIEDSPHEVHNGMFKLTIDDFGKVQTVRRSLKKVVSDTNDSSAMEELENSNMENADLALKKGTQDFPRNYRSTPRPKTEIIGITNRNLIRKFNSLSYSNNAEEELDEEEVELRDINFKNIKPILDELINSESSYVDSLFNGINNYGNIFGRQDLPLGLRGKKYVLLGNIEQIAEFHRDEFLPMLVRNRRNLKCLFDEFQQFVEQNCFYGYVIFTMNKQKSLKLCDEYKNYFKILQSELNDKLGINSFLVQPIQRIAKYPLMLKEFISALFETREIVIKPLIESCCRLDKKIRTLLTTTNESEVVNDIIDCHEFNVFYQGKFRKVSEFNVFDHTLKRSYRSKVFIFDKCIIYTEIKGKHLVFHGRYPCEHIGIVSKTKSFTLFYQKRKQQECDFSGEVVLIEMWMELIRDMVSSYATEERRKLQELYSRESDHMHRKPPSLSLFRDSNRFSTDSGIGNIWVMPRPEAAEDALSNRSTWYAVS